MLRIDSWLRFGRLILRVAVVGAVIWFLARGAHGLSVRLWLGPPHRRHLASVALFTAGALLLSGRHVAGWITCRTWSAAARTVARQGVSAMVVFALCSVAVDAWPVVSSVPGPWATLLAAASEEIVFRATLPIVITTAITRTSRRHAWRTNVLGIGIAQVIFAACHFALPGPSATIVSVDTFSRLIAGGLCYAVLFQTSGFWLATSVHAGLNLALTTAYKPAAPATGVWWNVAYGIIALAILCRVMKQADGAPHGASS